MRRRLFRRLETVHDILDTLHLHMEYTKVLIRDVCSFVEIELYAFVNPAPPELIPFRKDNLYLDELLEQH